MKDFSSTPQATVKSCLFSQGFFLVFQLNCLSKNWVTKHFELVHIRKADLQVLCKPEAQCDFIWQAGSRINWSFQLPGPELAGEMWAGTRSEDWSEGRSLFLMRKLKGLLSWHSLFEVDLKNTSTETLKSNGYCLQPGWELLCLSFLLLWSNRCQWCVTLWGRDWEQHSNTRKNKYESITRNLDLHAKREIGRRKKT